MGVRVLIAKLFAFWMCILGCTFAILDLLWRAIRHPRLVWDTIRLYLGKLENPPPACLRDPKYGTHSFIRVNGVRLHYVERGTGDELMLFLHGFPESWYSWRHMLVEFGTTHRVVAVDMRGYGDSDKPRGVSEYRMETLVEDVHQLIRALGHSRCILVAHDWGAAIAWRFAYTHPEQLTRLVIMNVPHPKGFRNAGLRQLLRSWYIFFFQAPILPELMLSFGNYRMLEGTFRGRRMGVRNRFRITDEDLAAFRYSLSRPGATTAAVNYYRNLLSSSNQRVQGVLEVPTLLLWGECDGALGKELTIGTDRYVKPLVVHYLPNCSHWTAQDEPVEVANAMREFLGTQFPTPVPSATGSQ